MLQGNRRYASWVAISLTFPLTIGAVGSAWAFSGGPGDGLTNAPGEGNCTACHADFPLNSGTGSLTISGLPDLYTPETLYSIEVVLADPDAMRWGFELTFLDGNNDFVGALASVDANTQVSTGGPFGRTYVKHTLAGTQNGQTGQGSWMFDWTAPAAGAGDVTIYVAGNAANGNFASSGDRIYATSVPWAEEPTTAVYAPEPIARLHPNYPNPFNPRTVVSFTLDKPADVELAVYDLRGSRVQVLHAGSLGVGSHAYVWDGMDGQGRPQASGIYLARLVDGAGHLLHQPVKMTLNR
jgi:hypothetical protein